MNARNVFIQKVMQDWDFTEEEAVDDIRTGQRDAIEQTARQAVESAFELLSDIRELDTISATALALRKWDTEEDSEIRLLVTGPRPESARLCSGMLQRIIKNAEPGEVNSVIQDLLVFLKDKGFSFSEPDKEPTSVEALPEPPRPEALEQPAQESEIHTDPCTGKKYRQGADGNVEWIEEDSEPVEAQPPIDPNTGQPYEVKVDWCTDRRYYTDYDGESHFL